MENMSIKKQHAFWWGLYGGWAVNKEKEVLT